jgi:hypothetical protein
MTKAEALQAFFSGFGIPAYEENSVYSMADRGEAPSMPYLTYEVKTDFFGDFDTNITFSLWYRSYKWTDIHAKSDEISAAIGRVGKILSCDGGRILVMKSQPWAQDMGDDSDDAVKRILHNLTLRYYTNN